VKISLARIFVLIPFVLSGVFGCAPEPPFDKSSLSPSQMDYQDMILVPAGEFLMGSTPENVKQAKVLFKEEDLSKKSRKELSRTPTI